MHSRDAPWFRRYFTMKMSLFMIAKKRALILPRFSVVWRLRSQGSRGFREDFLIVERIWRRAGWFWVMTAIMMGVSFLVRTVDTASSEMKSWTM